MTIYHYLGYYIGSLIIFLRNFKGDRLPRDPATFLEDLQQAGVISINNEQLTINN